jgi:hypothetical protein
MQHVDPLDKLPLVSIWPHKPKAVGIILICIALGLNLPAVWAKGDTVGQTTLKPVYGWGNAVRLGRWTCLFVTVADQQTRACFLEVHGTYGTGSAVLVRQRVVAAPQPTVYALYFPLNADPSHIAVSLIEESTGKTLASRLMQDPNSFTAAGQTPLIQLAAGDTLIGITGNIDDALALKTQLAQANLIAGVIEPARLPNSAVGLEGISVLILSAADFRDFDAGQEKAIVDWIAAGGNLVVIPGPEPVGPDSALLEILPCEIGINRAVATSPSQLNGRELNPRSGSEAIHLFGAEDNSDWVAYARQYGLGRIIVLPADICAMKFADSSSAVDFWRTVLRGMADVTGSKPVTAMQVSDELEEVMPVGAKMADSIGRGPRETLAIRHLLQTMQADQPHHQHDLPGMLLGLIAICAMLGPLDSLMMMRMGMPPRHWLIVVGWIGLVVAIGGYVAIRASATETQIRTIRLIDQADSKSVITTDLIAIESNRAEKVSLNLPVEWWEPANQAAGTFSPDRFLDVNLHEDQNGCRPENLKLNGGEAQSFRGEVIGAAPAMLEVKLFFETDAAGKKILNGTLKNLSGTGMSDIWVQSSYGNFSVDESTLPVGGTVQIDHSVTQNSGSASELPGDVYDLASDQADKIGALVRTGKFACVFAEMPDTPGVGVIDGVPAVEHWQLIRAVVPLQNP